PLYRGASRVSVVRQAREAGYVPVRQVSPLVPRALERICHKAMAADPAQRYRTAAELQRALRWFRARRWIAAAALVPLSAIAFAWVAPRTQPMGVGAEAVRKPTSPTVPRAEVPSVPSPAAPLRILELRVKPSPELPIYLGDDVQVSARLDGPAYGYLIALAPEGQVQLCYPPTETSPPSPSDTFRFEEFF